MLRNSYSRPVLAHCFQIHLDSWSPSPSKHWNFATNVVTNMENPSIYLLPKIDHRFANKACEQAWLPVFDFLSDATLRRMNICLLDYKITTDILEKTGYIAWDGLHT